MLLSFSFQLPTSTKTTSGHGLFPMAKVKVLMSGLSFYCDPLSIDWSPDSQWIVFTKDQRLWKIQVDGQALKQLTFSIDKTLHHFPLLWSPDGKKIIFDSVPLGRTLDQDVRTQTWMIDSDGHAENLMGVEIGPIDWSPDSLKIAFNKPQGYGWVYHHETGFWEWQSNGADSIGVMDLAGHRRHIFALPKEL